MITNSPAPAPAPAPAATTPAPKNATPSSTLLTRQQRAALFDEAARGMTPERATKKAEDPVKAWVPQIMRKHRQGFSPRQIATMSSAPGIALNLSVRAIERVIAQHRKPDAKPADRRKAG